MDASERRHGQESLMHDLDAAARNLIAKVAAEVDAELACQFPSISITSSRTSKALVRLAAKLDVST